MATDPTRAQAVFLAAADLADPAERAAFIERECAGDELLFRRVEALLRAHDDPDSLLDAPIVPAAGGETRTQESADAPEHADTRTHGDGASDDLADALSVLAPSVRPDSLGRIGHYEVLEVLGRGGFGIVYRAFDDVLQRVVAVKVLAPSMAATSPARKRFLREARSSAQVRHENVVHVYAVEEQPLPYLVMEFVPGETLQQRLDRTGPLDVPEVLRIGRQIAAGLAAAHEQGLIHRDIKPSNILIDSGPQPQVKITDFGLARAADDASLTRSGVVAGTPMYMAPEQAKGESLGHRADLFSLGSVLYAMLTGRPPFRAANTPAVLKRVAEDDPRPIREIIPEVPDWFCRIVGKLHAKDAVGRFQTAQVVAELLAECEQQVKAHGGLKDFSRIPGGKTERRPGRIRRAAVAIGLMAIISVCLPVILFRSAIYRYASDGAEVEFVTTADPDVEKLLVRRDGELVATLDRTNRRATLAPGEYEVEAVCIPGYEATKFQVDSSGLWRASGSFERVEDRPMIRLTVRRGDATTVAATAERRIEGPGFGEWGTAVDPKGDCRIQASANGLAITVPGGEYNLNPLPQFNDFSAPRVLQAVEGDFQMEVRIDAFPPPAIDKTSVPKSYVGAGLVLWQDAKNFVRFLRAANGLSGRIFFHTECFRNGWLVTSNAANIDDVPVALRVTRTGKVVRLTHTTNGTDWVEVPLGTSVVLPDRLEAGVIATHSTATPFTAQFSGFSLRRSAGTSNGFDPLFNGKDLTGWKYHPNQPGHWRVTDGFLEGGGKDPCHLFSERGDYTDFHLRVRAKARSACQSAIFFRAPFSLPEKHLNGTALPAGYKTLIALHPHVPPTGSLPGFTLARDGLIKADEWFDLEVVALGKRLVVKVNGQTTADVIDSKEKFSRGHIALQQLSADTSIFFSKIEIRELTPAGEAKK